MSDQGPFNDRYIEFMQHKDRMPGYEFQQAPAGNVPPPTVTFAARLKWWTWDRWRRIKQIRAARDRWVEEIVELRTRRQS